MSKLKNILSVKELPVFFGVILVFIVGLQKNYGPDVGFHLQSAKWMIENGKILSSDVFTYTSFGNNYFDLQWLYQLVLYGLYKTGKDELLVIINAALISFSVFLAWLRCRTESGNKLNAAVFLVTVIIGIQALMFEVRPHVFLLAVFIINLIDVSKL